MTVRVVVNGAAGRMGQTVVETAGDRDDVTVVGGIDANSGAQIGIDLYDPDDLTAAVGATQPDVVVDFTVPSATTQIAEACAEAGVNLVIGTTGFDDRQVTRLKNASDTVSILKEANFSRGIQAFLRALEPALAALPEYDIELSETHHNAKRDAPSGTATTILETIQASRDVQPVYGREGVHQRSDDEIGVLVSRLGDVRGEHEVRIGDNDEVLTIGHRAEDRAVFAAGALDAAVWLAEREPGWYTFGDVIGYS